MCEDEQESKKIYQPNRINECCVDLSTEGMVTGMMKAEVVGSRNRGRPRFGGWMDGVKKSLVVTAVGGRITELIKDWKPWSVFVDTCGCFYVLTSMRYHARCLHWVMRSVH